MKALVTGGCGFIGSALVRRLVRHRHTVVNIDNLTYAGDPRTVAAVAAEPCYIFRRLDIGDADAVAALMAAMRPDVVFHLAAESHVDRSIDGPGIFIDTNVRGTYTMLEAARVYWSSLEHSAARAFRFVHVSTDEVYGSLGASGTFVEDDPYRPNSPYAASKAAADHLVRAWYTTYGLPAIVSNCCNNYGPYQNREKPIPTIIRKALASLPIPIYGRGENVRDWLYVDDHVDALLAIAAGGTPGSRYLVGARAEARNIDLARTLCRLLDDARPHAKGRCYEELLTFVADRPGHDLRYAVNPTRVERELGWRPAETLASGLAKTLAWYLDHSWWLGEPKADDRLGLSAVGKD
jgi:dTDP-glucose 4,6-dehydratase